MEDPLPGTRVECCRCRLRLAKPIRNSVDRTAAFSMAALALYVPANIYPVLRIDSNGMYSENTIWDGCVRLFEDGQWFVAVVVFSASILIPLLKLLGLFFLVLAARFRFVQWRRERTRIARLIETIGPWAMLDVFLAAILVALVQLGTIATVLPGPGLIAFTAVVVLTMLAAGSFDSRLIWSEPHAAA